MKKEDAALLRDILGESAAKAAERNICGWFGCKEDDVRDFRLIPGGMTNVSLRFRLGGEEYVYRHPGSGPESDIDRRKEREALLFARDLGLNSCFLHIDPESGWMLSRFVPDFQAPDYDSEADTARVVRALRTLHGSAARPARGLRPWEDACALEEQIRAMAPGALVRFEALRKKIARLYARTLGDGVQPCFCHGDAYRNNWMLTPDGETILIDWEYAGTADPGVDTGYYILDAMYGPAEAERFLRAYLGESFTAELMFHHLAYTAVIGWHWALWAQHRLLCGTDTGAYLDRWLETAALWAERL